ncbi:MAG TPA: ABC transporter permease [Dehalococcoidales bacterium]
MDANAGQVVLGVAKEARRPFLVDLVVRLVREKPLGTVGGGIVLVLLLVAIFADVIAPYGVNQQILIDRVQPPSATHLLGTDNLGRDLLSRIIYGARISIYVGLGGSVICTVVAAAIGLASGFFGGKLDLVIQRFVDSWMCFPALFVYLTVMSLLGPGLVQVTMVLGIERGIAQSRVVRGTVIGIKENIYVEAARSIGCTSRQILVRHVLPNIMAPLITIFAVSSGYVILGEATLSFLGFGIPPPTPSWGAMLSGSGRRYMLLAPWMALWPGLALAIVVYGLNMLGDAMRDLLDPRLRGGIGRYRKAKETKHSREPTKKS